MSLFKPQAKTADYGTLPAADTTDIAPEAVAAQRTIQAIAALATHYLDSSPSRATGLTRREIMHGRTPNAFARVGLDVPLTKQKAELVASIETSARLLHDNTPALHANNNLVRVLEEWVSLLYLAEDLGYTLTSSSNTPTLMREIATRTAASDDIITNDPGEFGRIFGQTVQSNGRVTRSIPNLASPDTISAHCAALELSWPLDVSNKPTFEPLLTSKVDELRANSERLTTLLTKGMEDFNENVGKLAAMSKAKSGCFRFCRCS